MARHQHRDRSARIPPGVRPAGCASANSSAMRSPHMLTRGDIHDPVIETHMITVPEVPDADLRLATAYMMRSAATMREEVLGALENDNATCAARSRGALT